jgi:peptidoglycan hydrolase CwlO-like protein
MKTDRLEEFIKANREEFDQFEPSDKVWEQISKSGHKPKTVSMASYLLRVAAVLAIAVVFTVLLAKTNVFGPHGTEMQAEDPEIQELIEAEAFYASQVNEKMDEIRKCYNTFPEIKEDVEMDLIELQEMYDTLKSDLNENISKKAVIEAMIENNRYRLKMVDQVLEQINC